MDQNKICNFIKELRKEKGLTQMELAERLGVSNKSISKWENARCMPDISLFELLCNEFGITLTELLSGRKLNNDEKNNELNQHLINIIKYFKKYIKRLFKILIICVVFLVISFIIYILLEKYNSKKIYLEHEEIDISICKNEGQFFNNDTILVDIIDNNGYQVAKEIFVVDDKIYIKAYREIRYLKHPEKDPQGLNLISIQKNKDYKIYINENVLNGEIVNCVYN